MEHSHTHSFTYCLWLLSCYSDHGVVEAAKPKILARIGPLKGQALKLRRCLTAPRSCVIFSRFFLLLAGVIHLLLIYMLKKGCKLCPAVEPGRSTMGNTPLTHRLSGGSGSCVSVPSAHRLVTGWVRCRTLRFGSSLRKQWGYALFKEGYELEQGWVLCEGCHRTPAPPKEVGIQNGPSSCSQLP